MNIQADVCPTVWVRSFIERHGRSPRVLHIGNIANNAYLNAKFLRAAGIDCDVICHDYYHIMACPEWEDADFHGDLVEQYAPDWSALNLHGFRRPTWFVQGPLVLCIEYLIAKRGRNDRKAGDYWLQLSISNKTRKEPTNGLFKLFALIQTSCQIRFPMERGFHCKVGMRPFRTFEGARNIYNNFSLTAPKLITATLQFVMKVLACGVCLLQLPFERFRDKVTKRREPEYNNIWENPRFHDLEGLQNIYREWAAKWNNVFKAHFPRRSDSLLLEDIIGYYDLLPKFRQLFSHYDLIQGYATDGISALLAGSPYVAYEHGTIRNIPFQESAAGRLCALTYRHANHVCITNADNVVAAEKLGLQRYTFVPHPINEAPLKRLPWHDKAYSAMHREFNSDFLVFHPARQHWDVQRHPDWEKGNDVFIEGFADFVKRVNRRAIGIFVEWGNSVEKSKSLIKELGISDNIAWIKPVNATGMAKYIHCTDLLADQFFLGAFGSTLPRALACGKPAMLYVNEELHSWCFQQPPPVVNVRNSIEVFDGLSKVYNDKEWVKDLTNKGMAWYQQNHSNQVILEKLSRIYEAVLSTFPSGDLMNECAV